MKTFALIGSSITYSLSPVMHYHCLHLFGVNGRYMLMPTTLENLPLVADQLRAGTLDGLNVTLPFKTAIISSLDDLSEAAERTLAANCITAKDGHLIGHNTDVDGIKYTLDMAGISLPGKKCIIMGHGGAARAALAVLRGADVAAITIAGRRQEALAEFARKLGGKENEIPITTLDLAALDTLEPYDIVINATPVGMTPKAGKSIVPAQLLHPELGVLDMVYNPVKTQLLEDAEKAGCTTADGVDMLIGQGLASQAIWSTVPAARLSGEMLDAAERAELRTVMLDAIDIVNATMASQGGT